MTKSKEIIKTVDELARHYWKKLIRDWMPWILTLFLIWVIARIMAEMMGEIGETKTITTTWGHVLATPLLMAVIWNVGCWAGESIAERKYKKDDEDNDK